MAANSLAASIGADEASLDIAGQTLVAIHDWTFLFGPGFCVGVNDARFTGGNGGSLSISAA